MIIKIFLYGIIINIRTLKYLLSVNHMLCVKKQKKLCCIVISYCELKLKCINIIFVKNNKRPIKRVITYINRD